jgi:hypothetical protein
VQGHGCLAETASFCASIAVTARIDRESRAEVAKEAKVCMAFTLRDKD